MNLSDVFYFETAGGIYRMTKVCAHMWNVVEYSDIDNPEALRSDWPEDKIVANLEGGVWKMVDEPVKKLPDEFYFTCNNDSTVFKAVRDGDKFDVTWDTMLKNIPMDYSEADLQRNFKIGNWRILDKKPLTAEQQKAVKEMKEQVTALESSIKLNEQDITHKQRLIASYNERKDVLLGKINEMEG